MHGVAAVGADALGVAALGDGAVGVFAVVGSGAFEGTKGKKEVS